MPLSKAMTDAIALAACGEENRLYRWSGGFWFNHPCKGENPAAFSFCCGR